MDHIDFLGLAGLLVGLAALAVAIFGIRDVRDQVRSLVTLERNRSYARLLDGLAWRFVDRSPDLEPNRTSGEVHEFSLLVRFLDQSLTLEDAQEYAYYEALSLADEFVRLGFATWRQDFDEAAVKKEIKKWQSERNSAVLNRMFGEYRAWLSKPKKLL